MSDVKMSVFDCFFGTVLPDMRAKDFSAGSEYYVGGGVVVAELVSAFTVYDAAYFNIHIFVHIIR